MGARWLDNLNRALVRGQVRERRGRLYYRSSHFPAKKGGDGGKLRCELGIGVDARAAERDVKLQQWVKGRVMEWDVALLWKKWEWPEEKEQAPLKTVADLIKGYEAWYWRNKEQTLNKRQTFAESHLKRLSWLPQDKLLVPGILEQVLAERTEAGSAQRLRSSQVYAMFAEYAGLDAKPIKELGKGWESSCINPRDLPTVSEIVQQYQKLAEHPDMQAGYLVMVLYGIRPHELVYCQPLGINDASPWIHITEGKTGSRDAYELRVPELELPRWDGSLPAIASEGKTHKQIGASVREAYKALGITNLYNLRHHYAAMGFQLNKPIDKMALSMGHSQTVHVKTYRAWVTREMFQAGW